MPRRRGGPPAGGGGDGHRAVVIQTAHLGDVVLTLPLLHALAARHGPVDVVTTPSAAPLLEGQPPVRAVLPFDKHGRDSGARGLWRMARRLQHAGYASAWLPHRSLRSGLLARLAGIPRRTGFERSPGSICYSHRIRYPGRGHQVDRLAALAGVAAPRPPWYRVPEGADREAVACLAAARVSPPFVVVAPGARWGTKRWPGFPALAAALDLPVVVVGGPEDQPLGGAIVAAAAGRAVNLAGTLSLPGSAGVIARGALVVSNDSLPLHLAGALGRPVVALFGPTVPGFGFGPLGVADRVVAREGLPCRPCSPHGPPTCPLGHHRCMQDLGVAAVLAAIRDRLLAGQ